MNQKRFFPRFHFMIYCLFLTLVISFILFYTLCHSLSALPWPFPSVASMNEQNLLSYLHQVQRPSFWASLTFLRFLIYVCFRFKDLITEYFLCSTKPLSPTIKNPWEKGGEIEKSIELLWRIRFDLFMPRQEKIKRSWSETICWWGKSSAQNTWRPRRSKAAEDAMLTESRHI